MHVAFGRVRRKSRIVADYTDCADFKDFCLPSVLVRITGVWVLGSEDANWKVCGTKVRSRESEFPPTEDTEGSRASARSYRRSQKESGIGVPSYHGFGT